MNEILIVSKAQYICSAVNKEQYPLKTLPEFAFIGRSNVGKSSLINSISRVNQLARVSVQPGKTQTINFYELTIKDGITFDRKRVYLVDLPGYGYAKTSKSNRKQWEKFIEEYFISRKNLCFVCLLLDIRHTPMKSDIEMFQWLIEHNIPVLILATKSDKIGKNIKNKNIKFIKEKLGIKDISVLPYSSKKNEGRLYLLDAMYSYLIE